MTLTFEDKYNDIDRELEKKRYKWTLKAIPSLDYSDVKQIIMIHIWEKFGSWDQSRDFLPWVNAIIRNHTINILRNLYLNIASPCVNCPANEGDGKCRIYGIQSNSCKLFAKWEKSRKNAYNVKLPVSIENHEQEIFEIQDNDLNIEGLIESLHPYMKQALTPIQYKLYQHLFIEGKTEEEAALLMDFKTKEKNRDPGYKQILNIKKIIVEKAKKIIAKHIY